MWNYVEVHTLEDIKNPWYINASCIDRIVRQPGFTSIVVNGLLLDCVEPYEYIEDYVVRNNMRRIRVERTDW